MLNEGQYYGEFWLTKDKENKFSGTINIDLDSNFTFTINLDNKFYEKLINDETLTKKIYGFVEKLGEVTLYNNFFCSGSRQRYENGGYSRVCFTTDYLLVNKCFYDEINFSSANIFYHNL